MRKEGGGGGLDCTTVLTRRFCIYIPFIENSVRKHTYQFRTVKSTKKIYNGLHKETVIKRRYFTKKGT